MKGKLKWKNFIAYDYHDLIASLEKVCDEFHYLHEGGPGRPSVLLGSNENSYLFHFWVKKDDRITIRVVEAVADPVTKVAAHLNGSRKSFGGACLVEVIPFDKKSKEVVRKVFSQVAAESPRQFWDLSYHPRFRLAFLLRLRVKQNWVQFLQNG